MGGFAWVTLATTDSYSLGALVLAHSLKQVNTKHQLAILITPGVTGPMRNKLKEVYNLVQEVNVLDSKDETNLRLLKRPELGVTFTKLHCWRLTQFEKCVFLDADTLVLENCDELFEREELSAAPDVGWPDCFNSGVFVYRPSNETFTNLIQFALDRGSFDGGDQGLLNMYFSDWAHKDISKHLPFIYNMTSTASYSYLPAFKQFGKNAKIVHFIGGTKPWLQYFDVEHKKVRPSPELKHIEHVLQHWWDIFCNSVHPALSQDMTGLAGAFAKLTLGVPRTAEQAALDDHLRRQGWEVGNIDYLGRDSFDNIWSKICETMSSVPAPAADTEAVKLTETPPPKDATSAEADARTTRKEESDVQVLPLEKEETPKQQPAPETLNEEKLAPLDTITSSESAHPVSVPQPLLPQQCQLPSLPTPELTSSVAASEISTQKASTDIIEGSKVTQETSTEAISQGSTKVIPSTDKKADVVEPIDKNVVEPVCVKPTEPSTPTTTSHAPASVVEAVPASTPTPISTPLVSETATAVTAITPATKSTEQTAVPTTPTPESIPVAPVSPPEATKETTAPQPATQGKPKTEKLAEVPTTEPNSDVAAKTQSTPKPEILAEVPTTAPPSEVAATTQITPKPEILAEVPTTAPPSEGAAATTQSTPKPEKQPEVPKTTPSSEVAAKTQSTPKPEKQPEVSTTAPPSEVAITTQSTPKPEKQPEVPKEPPTEVAAATTQSTPKPKTQPEVPKLAPPSDAAITTQSTPKPEKQPEVSKSAPPSEVAAKTQSTPKPEKQPEIPTTAPPSDAAATTKTTPKPEVPKAPPSEAAGATVPSPVPPPRKGSGGQKKSGGKAKK